MLAGDAAQAQRILDQALPLATDASDRAQLLIHRARVSLLVGDGPTMLPVFERAIDELAELAPATAGELLLDVVLVKLYAGHPDALEQAGRASELVAGAGEELRIRADTVEGLACMFSGQPERAHLLLGRSADLIRIGGDPSEIAHLMQHAVVGLAGVEQYQQAMALCRRFVRVIRSVGADGLLPLALCYLANTAYFLAAFDEQEVAAAEAMDLAAQLDQPGLLGYARACRALAIGVRLGGAEVRDELERSLTELDVGGMTVLQGPARLGLALSEMANGDWDRATDRFVELADFMRGIPAVPGVLHWQADRAEALWRSGRHAEAQRALVEMAEQSATSGPWEQAALCRVRGTIGAPEDADGCFTQAMRWHAESSSSFERARTELCWAEWLFGAHRYDEAVERVTIVRESFVQLEATAWVERADALLASIPEPALQQTPADQHDHVVVQAFGPLTVVRDGVPVRVALDVPGTLIRALVAAGGTVRAEELVERLWPNSPDGVGNARLRTVLSRARRRYGAVVVRDGAALRWADGVEVDAHRFEILGRRAANLGSGEQAAVVAREAIELYRDDLMVLDRSDDAVMVARERQRQRYLGLLDLLAEHEEKAGNLRSSADLLRSAIERDRLNETRYLRLAELFIDMGHTASARQALHEAESVVGELGLAVPVRLTTLLERC